MTAYTEASKAKITKEFGEGVLVSVQGTGGFSCADATALAAAILPKLPKA